MDKEAWHAAVHEAAKRHDLANEHQQHLFERTPLCPSIWGLSHVSGFALCTLFITYSFSRSLLSSTSLDKKDPQTKEQEAVPPQPFWSGP